MSWPAAAIIPRFCNWEKVKQVRAEIALVLARPIVVHSEVLRKRAYSAVPLGDLVGAMLQLVQHTGQLTLPQNGDPIRMVVCCDACPLWNASSTRFDIFCDIWGSIAQAGNPELVGYG